VSIEAQDIIMVEAKLGLADANILTSGFPEAIESAEAAPQHRIKSDTKTTGM
jgi:hypothetical protein